MPAGLVALFVVLLALPTLVLLAMIFLPSGDKMIPDPGRGRANLNSWQFKSCHRAPFAPFTTEQAQKEMQWLRACSAEQCERKAAALYTLADAGLVTPDSSRRYR